MHSIDAAYCYTRCGVVCVTVCLYVTGSCKTAELIEMPFGMWARVDASNHVLYEGLDPHGEWAISRSAYSTKRFGFLSNYFDQLFILLKFA